VRTVPLERAPANYLPQHGHCTSALALSRERYRGRYELIHAVLCAHIVKDEQITSLRFNHTRSLDDAVRE
jgi:hypothetical protein